MSDIALRLTTRGTVAAVLIVAACRGEHAPTDPGTRGAPPTIVAVDVTPTLVEPGGTLVVHYHVTSEEPLRKLRFFRSGAMTGADSIGGRGSTDVTDSIALPVPSTVATGGSIVVRMEAEDTLHRVATRTAAGVAVRDTTPPRLDVQFGPNYYPSVDSLRFSTEDTVRFTIQAADNAGVKWVGFRTTGAVVAADSMVPGDKPSVLRLPLHPSSTGSSSFVVFARDASGNERTLIAHASVYPVVDRPTQRLAFAGVLGQFLFDSTRAVLLGTRTDTAAIEVFALSPLGHVGQIALAAQPGTMELSAGGDSLFVMLPSVSSLAVIDLKTRTVVSTIPLLASAMVNRLAGDVASATNGKVFIGLLPNGAAGGNLLELDLTTGEQRVRTDRSPLATRLTSSGDHRRIAVNSYPDCEQIYEAATDAFGPCASTWPPSGGALSSDLHGTTFLWGPTLLDAGLNPVRFLNAPRFYSPVSQITSDGALAIFSAGYLAPYGFGFVIIRTKDGSIVEQQSLPMVPDVLYVLPDGSAVVTQGTVCEQLSANSYSCRRLGDVFVTTLHS